MRVNDVGPKLSRNLFDLTFEVAHQNALAQKRNAASLRALGAPVINALDRFPHQGMTDVPTHNGLDKKDHRWERHPRRTRQCCRKTMRRRSTRNNAS
jgi:hypothetical protein